MPAIGFGAIPDFSGVRGFTSMPLNPESLLPEAIDPDEFARLLEQRELLEATELAGRFGHCQWNSDTLSLESCSEGFARLFGMTQAEALARLGDWNDLLAHIHPDDRERYAEIYGPGLHAGTYTVDYRIVNNVGEIRWVHQVSVLKLSDSDGTGTGFSILQDITGQVEREQKLLNSEDLTDQIEAATDLGHFIFDEENDGYLYVSPGYARIHGISQAAYMRRSATFDETGRSNTAVSPDNIRKAASS